MEKLEAHMLEQITGRTSVEKQHSVSLKKDIWTYFKYWKHSLL